MTINLDQNDGLEKQQLSQDTDDQIKFSGESRRRFATSGLAVSGVILTLASRPVLGADAFCLSPSGFCSGNTSQHGACPPASSVTAKFVTNPDETFLTAFPKSNQSNTSYNSRRLSDMLTIPWPEPQVANVNAPVQAEKGKLGAASYMTAFRASSGSNSSAQKGKGANNITVPTSTSVIAPPNPPFQTQELLQCLVKALQHARSGATPYLTEDRIRSMFYEWQDHGTFSPTVNVNWNASEIIYYLKQTQNN
ncbi:hypothetical protein [Candidatus Nitrotoga arctica]|uniref:Uncharacterized protein n=1 Tax=Candidatus Nitrotoga arctica TaxID=453162 RepID=A0ABM8Z0W0_9PROT|nr:hypothetical protein [Candidatus Nitrotoga arctica]CAG9933485.1 conserved protein of unknown function [Candidatus Nitrotoga arctica]